MANETENAWEAKYQTGDTPWEMAGECDRLAGLVQAGLIRPCHALELGCGSGAVAVHMAQLGFQVTALDIAPTAIEQARRLAANSGLEVNFVCADVTQWPGEGEPFDFVYDRGCYHVIRRDSGAGYLATLVRVTRPGSQVLLLAGNAAEPSGIRGGPPGVTEDEIRTDFAPWFDIVTLEPFHLQGRQGQQGPLFWSCRMVRVCR
ncbi:MAG: class I SAM-dependent methyltransferase [Candidatus Anammoximicrobium sp.]|nr:class I SAM-dependent methyltransferase [Candidatus Anammoximicrobium sp.]